MELDAITSHTITVTTKDGNDGLPRYKATCECGRIVANTTKNPELLAERILQYQEFRKAVEGRDDYK